MDVQKIAVFSLECLSRGCRLADGGFTCRCFLGNKVITYIIGFRVKVSGAYPEGPCSYIVSTWGLE